MKGWIETDRRDGLIIRWDGKVGVMPSGPTGRWVVVIPRQRRTARPTSDWYVPKQARRSHFKTQEAAQAKANLWYSPFKIEAAHVVLRGIIEHRDPGYYFGSTCSLKHWIQESIDCELIREDHTPTQAGINIHAQYLQALPQCRWTGWKLPHEI